MNLGIEKYPCDDFFTHVMNETLKISPEAGRYYLEYEIALDKLDPESWEVLKEKAIAHFTDHRDGQKKQGFFNQLNDVFAYEYLTENSCHDVHILQEGAARQPDIEYMNAETKYFCEVKTINISEDEIIQRSGLQISSTSADEELSSGFLEKLKSTLDDAGRQINARGGTGLIYIVMHFDNIAYEDHWDRYCKQISDCLEAHPAKWIHVRIGVLGKRRICKYK